MFRFDKVLIYKLLDTARVCWREEISLCLESGGQGAARSAAACGTGAGLSVMAGPASVPLIRQAWAEEAGTRPSQEHGAPGKAWGTRSGLVTGSVAASHRQASPEGILWAGARAQVSRAQGQAALQCRWGCSSGQAKQWSFSWKAAPAGRGVGLGWGLPAELSGSSLRGKEELPSAAPSQSWPRAQPKSQKGGATRPCADI